MTVHFALKTLHNSLNSLRIILKLTIEVDGLVVCWIHDWNHELSRSRREKFKEELVFLFKIQVTVNIN